MQAGRIPSVRPRFRAEPQFTSRREKGRESAVAVGLRAETGARRRLDTSLLVSIF